MKSLLLLSLFCALSWAHALDETSILGTPLLGDPEITLTGNNTTAPLTPSTADETALIGTALELPTMRETLTIIETSDDLIGSDDVIEERYGKMLQDFSATLESYDPSNERPPHSRLADQIFSTKIGFVLEILLTWFAIRIALKASGFRRRPAQVLSICGILALVSAIISYFLQMGPFNPVRIALTFIVLTILIREITDAREWATAAKIAAITRIIYLIIIGLAFLGLDLATNL